MSFDPTPYLQRLPYVCWDRYIDAGEWLFVYGWIVPEDPDPDAALTPEQLEFCRRWRHPGNGRDYVQIEFYQGTLFSSSSSSVQYSERITRDLHGSDDHWPCQRVEDRWPGLRAWRPDPKEQPR